VFKRLAYAYLVSARLHPSIGAGPGGQEPSVARCGATLTVTNRDRPTTASEIFAILQASSLGFAKIHTGPYATSVISTDFIEDVCGLMCILTKPNNKTCKIVNSSLLAGFLPLSLSRAHRKEGSRGPGVWKPRVDAVQWPSVPRGVLGFSAFGPGLTICADFVVLPYTLLVLCTKVVPLMEFDQCYRGQTTK
jgi:hypothetical protein